jgi:hypothetical protein
MSKCQMGPGELLNMIPVRKGEFSYHLLGLLLDTWQSRALKKKKKAILLVQEKHVCECCYCIHASRGEHTVQNVLHRKGSKSTEAAISFNSVALTYMINGVIQPLRSLRSVRYRCMIQKKTKTYLD